MKQVTIIADRPLQTGSKYRIDNGTEPIAAGTVLLTLEVLDAAAVRFVGIDQVRIKNTAGVRIIETGVVA